MDDNEITNVIGLGRLKNLQRLYLGQNQLKICPEGVDVLEQLIALWVNCTVTTNFSLLTCCFLYIAVQQSNHRDAKFDSLHETARITGEFLLLFIICQIK